MTDPTLPPAITGTEMRLDALIARLDRLCALVTPVAAPEPEPEPEPEPRRVELREPTGTPMKPTPKRTRP